MPATTTGVATSFIDFTRASNATVTDSDGKVKWAPHNLLTNSESFNAASWTKSSVTPTANSIAAPNGTTTADTLAASGANGTTLQTFTAEAISYTFGVWLKRKTGTGNIQIAADSGTYTTVTITSDWALYTVTQTPTAGSKTAGIRIVTSADEVYAWGASLYRSDLAMQPNTSAYPLYNPTTPKNLLGYTEDFANAYWSKSNLAATPVIANVILAPNGLQTADKIVEDTTTNTHSISKTGIAVNIGSQNTVSISVKGSGRTQCMLQYFDGTTNKTPVFSLADGTKVVDGGIGSSWSAVSQGDGWWRFSITVTTATASAGIYVYPCVSGSASYTGDGTSGIYLWGAQLSDSASLDPYSPVYGAAATSAAYYGPRRDFDPVTLACKGLLVEEQRANLTTYSSEFDNAAWGKANLNTTGTPAWVNVQTAPDGNLSADKLIESNTTAQHYVSRAQTVTSGSTYTLSFYLRAGERTWAWLEFYSGIPTGTVYINLSTGAKGTTTGSASAVTVTNVGGGWWRVVLPGFVASSTTPAFAVYTSTGNGVNSYAGDGTSGIYIWGAQLEENASFATSYIPVGSTSAGATRLADVASVSTQAFPYSQGTGTIVANNQALSQMAGAFMSVASLASGLDESNLASVGYQTSGATTRMLVINTGSSQADLSPSGASASTPNKLGLAFATNDFSAVVNGGTAATDPTGSAPVATGLFMGASSAQGISRFNGHIRQITYLPRRVTNAELQTRTS